MLNTRRRRTLACAGVTAALCAVVAPQALAGPLNAGGSVDLLTESNVRIGNLPAAAKVGDKIAAAGDFNGDGIRDVALGMWMLGADGPTRAQAGAIYVVYGKASQGASVDLAALGSGGVRIEGAFEGEIALRGMLVIGETGRVTCQNVRANTVIVAGAVRGNITTQKLEIRGSGRVWGDVVTTAFVTEEGAFLRGQIRMEETVELDLEPTPETTPSEAAQAESIASTPMVIPEQMSEGTTRKITRKKRE